MGSGAVLQRTDQPHRIALFSGNYNCIRDGANRALNRLTAHALTRGNAVRVYSPTIAAPAFAPAGDLVSVRSWPIPFRPDYRLAPGLPMEVAADVHRFAPSVIHVSAPDGLGAAAIRLGRALGIPVVASMHTRFEAYLEYYHLSLLHQPVRAWLRRFYRRCDLVLVPSQAMADELAQSGVESIRIWSRGVDRAQFAPVHRDMAWRNRIGLADHEVALLFLGRLVAEKGLATFEAVTAALRAQGLPVRALIVGDGPERRRLAQQMTGAIFTGHLDADDLGRAVAAADIFVNPSLTEAFGNVTLEAMASGVPVIAADIPASRMLIEPGRTGLLVSPKSVPAYAEAVLSLLADGDKRRAISSAGIARARNFDWPQTLDAVLHAYREVSQPARCGSPRVSSLS
ncbi:glycosyltransferase family 4 protein [Sphingomonas koreensis]